MKRFDFNKVIVETPNPPRDTNMLWLDREEGTGKILFLREFKNGQWIDIVNSADLVFNLTQVVNIYEERITETEQQISTLEAERDALAEEQAAEKAALQAQIDALNTQLTSLQATVNGLQSATGDTAIINFLKSANNTKGIVMTVMLREGSNTSSGNSRGRGKSQMFMFKPATLTSITNEFTIDEAADAPSSTGKFYQVVSPITAIPSELTKSSKKFYVKFIYNADGEATLSSTGWKLYGTTEATPGESGKFILTNKNIRLVIDDYMDAIFPNQFVQKMVGTAFA